MSPFFPLLLFVILPHDSVIFLFCSLSLSVVPVWNLFLPKSWRKKRGKKILVLSLVFQVRIYENLHGKHSWFLDILLIAGRINQSPMMSSLSSADTVFQAKQTKHISYKSYYLKIHGEAHLKFLIVHFSI